VYLRLIFVLGINLSLLHVQLLVKHAVMMVLLAVHSQFTGIHQHAAVPRHRTVVHQFDAVSFYDAFLVTDVLPRFQPLSCMLELSDLFTS